jgi:hypothetical protein
VVSQNIAADSLNDFLLTVKSVYLKKAFPRIDYDKIRYGPSLFLYEVTRYFIQLKRTKNVLKMLEDLAE